MMHSHPAMTKEKRMCAQCASREKSWYNVSHLQIKERNDVAQGNIIIMHSHTVMDKGETRVCTSSKQSRVGAVLVNSQLANKLEKGCAIGNIILMHLHPVIWTKEKQEYAPVQSRAELMQCE